MRKRHICDELDARKIIISFCTRSPQVLWAYIFKDVYVAGPWFSRTKDLKQKKENKEEKVMETKGRRRRTKSSALGVESPESGRVPWVRL